MNIETKTVLITEIPGSVFVDDRRAPGDVRERNEKPTFDEGQKGNDDTGTALRSGRIRSSSEGLMCPACIASTAVIVAGAGSTGGILALCIGKFRKVFRATRLGLFQKTKEK